MEERHTQRLLARQESLVAPALLTLAARLIRAPEFGGLHADRTSLTRLGMPGVIADHPK